MLEECAQGKETCLEEVGENHPEGCTLEAQPALQPEVRPSGHTDQTTRPYCPRTQESSEMDRLRTGTTAKM